MAATEHAQVVKNDTKLFITTALLQLLRKEKLSNLTVSKVVKCAGVSRMAFYRNFDDLNQVLHDYYQPKIEEVFNTIRTSQQDVIKFESQLAFFDQFSADLLLSIEHGFEPIIQQIFTQQIEAFYRDEENPYWTTFISAGVYAIWRQWLMEGQVTPLEEIINLLKKIQKGTEFRCY